MANSLQFNVSQLLKGPVGETRSYDFASDEPLDLDEGTATNVRGHVKFTLTNFGILAAVQVHADLHLICARCLESFESPTDVSFQEEYQPMIDINTGLPSTAPRSESAFSISPNHMIDLGDAIRQQLLLSIEIIPLCDVACKGLCPTCGTNLNNEQCSCAPAEESSPFAALQALLADREGE